MKICRLKQTKRIEKKLCPAAARDCVLSKLIYLVLLLLFKKKDMLPIKTNKQTLLIAAKLGFFSNYFSLLLYPRKYYYPFNIHA